MIRKQLLGIIGCLVGLLGMLLPAGRTDHCLSFFDTYSEAWHLNRLACAARAQANLYIHWGYGTRWDFPMSFKGRIASAFLALSLLLILGFLVVKAYTMLWLLVPLNIALIIYLHSLTEAWLTYYPAYAALASSCILLLICASAKESSSLSKDNL